MTEPVVQPFDPGASPDRLFAGLHHRRHPVFLDSGLPADGLGRYSFIGFDPFLTFEATGTVVRLVRDGGEETHTGDPLDLLRHQLARHRFRRAGPLPFAGGAIGYLGYELGSGLAGIRPGAADDLPMPDIALGFYDGLLAFDHVENRAFLVAAPVHHDGPEAIFARLRAAVAEALAAPPPAAAPQPAPAAPPVSNFSRADYLAAVGRVKAYIAAGDVYQVNLTHRFEAPLPCPAPELHRRLRARNPAPFAAYLDLGGVRVLSSSPERFLRIEGRRVETRPIKGTRPRGATPAEDEARRAELLASAKDRAELLMIVDLERNDLGRVCEFGSVRVDGLNRLETFPTVHHLVATVSGVLRPEADVVDCLRAAFPGGSITGAPKIRAMQIIDGLETRRRHVYTGALGWIGFDGDADLNIAIRTLVCTADRACYHVGGGVVWDSDPAAEWQETLDKGRALHAALTGSEEGINP